MKKIYKIKVNNKAYEVELQEISSVEGTVEGSSSVGISTPTSTTPKATMAGGEEITAPMPGTIVDVLVKAGDTVEKGQLVAILEAMKMETEILAPNAGTIAEVQITKGATVNLGDAIATLG
ncbi:MAG TPA: acetyl-CoA carboxylase biotin carboxyl carrier protein subunit [Fusobacteriaceae bacterium]|nr:acetyl-CoA carboxylase biotin carboxyl carrier protein subunit [Fusobacteriaceae bacterium]